MVLSEISCGPAGGLSVDNHKSLPSVYACDLLHHFELTLTHVPSHRASNTDMATACLQNCLPALEMPYPSLTYEREPASSGSRQVAFL